MQFIINRIKSFLDEDQYNKEFLNKYKEEEKTLINPKEDKGVNIKIVEQKKRGKSIGNLIIKKINNYNNNKKIDDYFKHVNLNKDKNKKGNEFNIFLKETKQPAFSPVIKPLSKDKKMNINLFDFPNIKILKESKPIINEAFKNKDLMKKKENPGVANIFLDNTPIINNDIKILEKENGDINDPIIFENKFNQLKNMGFKNEDLIREALLLMKGNIEEAMEYISSVE